MKGQLLQQLKVGRLNNVDVRYGLPFAGQPHDVAVASLRNNNSLQLFAINAEGEVQQAGQIATQYAGDLRFMPVSAGSRSGRRFRQ